MKFCQKLIMACSSFFIGAFFLFSTAQAAVITANWTFHPGTFWSYGTYSYTVTADPDEIPYNDVHISFGDRTQIDLSSYSGPGSATFVAGTGNSGTLVVSTIAGGGFGNPINFSVDTITNPSYIEGTQSGFLTLNGVKINGSDTTFTPVPEPSTIMLIGLGIIGIGYAKRRKAYSFS